MSPIVSDAQLPTITPNIAGRWVRNDTTATFTPTVSYPPTTHFTLSAAQSNGVAMIRATDIDAGTIRVDNVLRVDPEELPQERKPYLKTGEIIVVRSGVYTGDSAIVRMVQ